MALKDFPTPANVNVFIGGYLIDDMYSISYEHSDGSIREYTTMSRGPVAVTSGKTITRGTLALNYRQPGYLYKAIELVRDKNEITMTSQESKSQAEWDREFYTIMRTGSVAERLDAMIAARERGHSIAKRGSKLLSAVLANQPKLKSGDILESSVFDDQFINYSQNSPIDIYIHYGRLDTEHSVDKLVDVVFTGVAKELNAGANPSGGMSASGVGILEIYSFSCKNIVSYTTNP